ncbi:MAG: hypothetical protein P8Z42_07340 [Anaerolineales bacterium]
MPPYHGDFILHRYVHNRIDVIDNQLWRRPRNFFKGVRRMAAYDFIVGTQSRQQIRGQFGVLQHEVDDLVRSAIGT